MKNVGFIFHRFPHSSASGREGLDAILATSAFTESISVFFIGDGVAQLIAGQAPEKILCRDYISSFKLLELYDIENIYVCEDSLHQLGLDKLPLVIEARRCSTEHIRSELHKMDQILSF